MWWAPTFIAATMVLYLQCLRATRVRTLHGFRLFSKAKATEGSSWERAAAGMTLVIVESLVLYSHKVSHESSFFRESGRIRHTSCHKPVLYRNVTGSKVRRFARIAKDSRIGFEKLNFSRQLSKSLIIRDGGLNKLSPQPISVKFVHEVSYTSSLIISLNTS